MKQRKTHLLLLLALTLGLLSACGGEDAPLSTGEQGGQVAAPDTLEGHDDTADGERRNNRRVGGRSLDGDERRRLARTEGN